MRGSGLQAEPSPNWTTLAALRSQSLKAWVSGALLRELLEPSGIYPRRRTLKRPTAAELRSDYAAARSWAAELFAAAGSFSVETIDVGRTTIGANQLPAAAVFPTVEDEISFAGKTRDAARFRQLAAALSTLDPALRQWALKRPLQLLSLGDAALTAAQVALWLRDNREPGIYVRQLSLPGVHTKFIETRRRIIDEMVAVLRAAPALLLERGEQPVLNTLAEEPDHLPMESALDPVAASTPAARFAERHGFLHPPELVRFRSLDAKLPLLGEARDVTVTAEAFGALQLPVEMVIVTENLVNFLALPERPSALAIFGAGYGFSAVRDAAWLRDCEILYWGDLDTHGFRILDQLRAVHPHVSSVLMDEATLLAHRDVWGSEPTPTRSAVTRLTPAESALYHALTEDTYGPAVRLEQELIRWDWALERLQPRG